MMKHTRSLPTPTKAEAHPLPMPPEERRAIGRKLRDTVPRASHGAWRAQANRKDPLAILRAADVTRQSDLVPLRYGRMLQTPFTFYRGSAAVMAADLAPTPSTGIYVQVCGDAHLMNFGGFATPERRLIFDINDLDETLPAPWEWDVKRLVGWFVFAARSNELSDRDGRDAAIACARSYRQTMREFAGMDVLETWYARLDEAAYLAMLPKSQKAVLSKRIAKATAQSSSELVFPKLADAVGGSRASMTPLPHCSTRRRRVAPTICRCATRFLQSTAKRWRKTGASCSTAITWWTWRSRWSASAASGRSAWWR